MLLLITGQHVQLRVLGYRLGGVQFQIVLHTWLDDLASAETLLAADWL